jgi:hypothetical protein
MKFQDAPSQLELRLSVLKFFFSHLRLFEDCQIGWFFKFFSMKRNDGSASVRMYKKSMRTVSHQFFKSQLFQLPSQFLRSRRQLHSPQSGRSRTSAQTRDQHPIQISLQHSFWLARDQMNLLAAIAQFPNHIRASIRVLQSSFEALEVENHRQNSRQERQVQLHTKFQARVNFGTAKLNRFSYSQYRTDLEVLT